jgi:hypothetical protein
MKSTNASKVTNGQTLFIEDVDGRSVYARRYRDLYQGFLSEVTRKGADEEVHRQVCRRAAALCVQAEGMEAELARGEEIDVSLYFTLTKTLLRVFNAFAQLSRRGKNTEPLSDEEFSEWLKGQGIMPIEG